MKIFTPQPRLYPYCALVQPKRNFSLSEKYTEFWVQLPFNSHLVSLSFYLGTTWNHWSSSSCRLTYCSLPSLHCRVSPAGAQCGSWLEGRSQDGFGLLRPTRLSGQTEGEDSSSETWVWKRRKPTRSQKEVTAAAMLENTNPVAVVSIFFKFTLQFPAVFCCWLQK